MKTSTIAVVLTVMMTAAATAHHGPAEFDQTKRVTLTGTVTGFRFVNPHPIVEFDVTGDDGRVTAWQAELTTTRRLTGWTATSLEPGVAVTIAGYPAKSGAPYLWVLSLSASNGRELNVPTGGPPALVP